MRKQDTAAFSTTSVQDYRPSAIAVGSGAAVVFVVILAGIFFLDIPTIMHHLRDMKNNFKEIWQEKGTASDVDRDENTKPVSKASSTSGKPSRNHGNVVGVAGSSGCDSGGRGFDCPEEELV